MSDAAIGAKTRARSYDSNLASEFYVLSCLHRLGMTANLTLGNKKGVDIVVAREAGDAVTVEVKGSAQKYDWVVNNLSSPRPNSHFVVLVGFEGRMSDQAMPAPRVWVIPYLEIQPFIRTYAKGRMAVVSRSAVNKGGASYENAWRRIAGEA